MLLTATKYEHGPTPSLMKRAWNDINRDAAKMAGIYWHTHFRPIHFTTEAFRRYDYQPRGRGYSIQKAKKWHHQRPLVWTGQSEQLTAIQDVRATATGGQYGSATARVVMHAPTLNLRASPNSPDLRKELTTVIPEELDEIGQAVGVFLEQRYRFLQLSAVTTIGGSAGQI